MRNSEKTAQGKNFWNRPTPHGCGIPAADPWATQNHYTVHNNISRLAGQIASEASVHIQRMGLRNG